MGDPAAAIAALAPGLSYCTRPRTRRGSDPYDRYDRRIGERPHEDASAFGCMRLPLTDPDDPTTIDMPQIEQMVDEFLAAGFTYFDTAVHLPRLRQGEHGRAPAR